MLIGSPYLTFITGIRRLGSEAEFTFCTPESTLDPTPEIALESVMEAADQYPRSMTRRRMAPRTPDLRNQFP